MSCWLRHREFFLGKTESNRKRLGKRLGFSWQAISAIAMPFIYPNFLAGKVRTSRNVLLFEQ
jgi:hypothetical protein